MKLAATLSITILFLKLIFGFSFWYVLSPFFIIIGGSLLIIGIGAFVRFIKNLRHGN